MDEIYTVRKWRTFYPVASRRSNGWPRMAGYQEILDTRAILPTTSTRSSRNSMKPVSWTEYPGAWTMDQSYRGMGGKKTPTAAGQKRFAETINP